MASKLVEFYTGEAFPGEWSSDNSNLESRHDYIQWWFPLQEPSRAVPNSPVLSAEDLKEFRTNKVIKNRMRVSLARMTLFFAQTDAWKRAGDHNHLRITRIIKSLVRVELNQEAFSFYYWVLSQDPQASTKTLLIWQSALARPQD